MAPLDRRPAPQPAQKECHNLYARRLIMNVNSLVFLVNSYSSLLRKQPLLKVCVHRSVIFATSHA